MSTGRERQITENQNLENLQEKISAYKQAKQYYQAGNEKAAFEALYNTHTIDEINFIMRIFSYDTKRNSL